MIVSGMFHVSPGISKRRGWLSRVGRARCLEPLSSLFTRYERGWGYRLRNEIWLVGSNFISQAITDTKYRI